MNKILIILALLFIVSCNKIENKQNQSSSIKSDNARIEKIRQVYYEIEYKIKNNKCHSTKVPVILKKEKYGLDYDVDIIITCFWEFGSSKLVKFKNVQISIPFRYCSEYYFYPNEEVAFCFSYRETDSGITRFEEKRTYYYNNEAIRVIIDDDPEFIGKKSRKIFDKPFNANVLKDLKDNIKWVNAIKNYVIKFQK
jgi:hypothetical protein